VSGEGRRARRAVRGSAGSPRSARGRTRRRGSCRSAPPPQGTSRGTARGWRRSRMAAPRHGSGRRALPEQRIHRRRRASVPPAPPRSCARTGRVGRPPPRPPRVRRPPPSARYSPRRGSIHEEVVYTMGGSSRNIYKSRRRHTVIYIFSHSRYSPRRARSRRRHGYPRPRTAPRPSPWP
jgi:hypothetical protein